jgi:type I restriction enzyme S subunit
VTAAWRDKRVGDIVRLEYGKPLSEELRSPNGRYPVYGANGAKDRTDHFYWQKPSLIIGRKGSAGEVNLTEDKFWPLDVTYFVTFNESENDLRFLYYLLSWLNLPQYAKGVKPGINRNEIYSLPVRIPSIHEQRRIVGILDEAFAGLEAMHANAEKNLANARALFDSECTRLMTTEDDTWSERPLRELCEIKHGFAFEGAYFSSGGEYVLMTPGNFFETGGYRDRGEKQKYYVGEIPDGYILSKGDLLVAMTEQAVGLLGSPAIVPEASKFLHNQRLGLVTSKPGIPWSNDYFFHVFNTPYVRAAIQESASGTKVRHTSPKKIGNVVVKFPNSISEQKRVARMIEEFADETEKLQTVYVDKLDRISKLKKSFLHQAFSGNL